ncbi:hypothetical protein CP556_01530 [Natrinema sp. CBA1119]|nr:hypothetical protein CP556_01530 [Natrinema sp. CBA1119]
MQLTDIDGGQVTDDDDSGTVVCVIVHAPTRTELADAARSCLAHASQIVGTDWADSAGRAELGRRVSTGVLSLDGGVRVSRGHVLALGVDSDRAHVSAGVEQVEQSPMTDVVVDSLATLGKNHAEIQDRVDTLVNAGVTLHLNDTAAEINSDSADALLGGLRSLDKAGVELQREAKVQDVRDWADGIDRDRGRAPLGFAYDDSGTVVPGEDYDEVRGVLSMVLDDSPDGLSKRRAAERLGVADRTIGRALDNLDRYGLEEEGEDIEE